MLQLLREEPLNVPCRPQPHPSPWQRKYPLNLPLARCWPQSQEAAKARALVTMATASPGSSDLTDSLVKVARANRPFLLLLLFLLRCAILVVFANQPRSSSQTAGSDFTAKRQPPNRPCQKNKIIINAELLTTPNHQTRGHSRARFPSSRAVASKKKKTCCQSYQREAEGEQHFRQKPRK